MQRLNSMSFPTRLKASAPEWGSYATDFSLWVPMGSWQARTFWAAVWNPSD
jgi:hypothetical protein